MKRQLLTSQVVILVLSFLWGVYIVTYWRTQSFGMTWRDLVADVLVVLFLVMPVAVVGVFGLPWRKACLLLFALCTGMVALAEVYAGAQEWWVVHRYGENPSREISVNRWSPFNDHHIGYSPGYGWWGAD
jgi:hypothetical protein